MFQVPHQSREANSIARAWHCDEAPFNLKIFGGWRGPPTLPTNIVFQQNMQCVLCAVLDMHVAGVAA